MLNHFTPGERTPQYPFNSRLGGPQSQSGRLGVKPLAPARIQNPDYPAGSLVATLTPLFRLFVLDMRHYFMSRKWCTGTGRIRKLTEIRQHNLATGAVSPRIPVFCINETSPFRLRARKNKNPPSSNLMKWGRIPTQVFPAVTQVLFQPVSR
jgi:hypothetical protein